MHGDLASGLLQIFVLLAVVGIAVLASAGAGIWFALQARKRGNPIQHRWCRRLGRTNLALGAGALAGIPLTGGGFDSWKLLPVGVVLGAIGLFGIRSAKR